MHSLSNISARVWAPVLMVLLFGIAAAARQPVKSRHNSALATDSVAAERPDSVTVYLGDVTLELPTEAIDSLDNESPYEVWTPRDVEFNPDPTRAVWLSALFPGLGQVYNRRYWKLPIVVGAYMGLGYATSWNNGMLTDYTRAYRDLMDNDPSTNSYMNFFPPTTQESDLDKKWLTNVMQSRKNFYRRNRDLCIIAMVGVYLIAMVDAYVDAQLSHFDISPDLSLDLTPTLLRDSRDIRPAPALVCAITF